jgi:aspartyl-tRNA(Asn)/glutamyl-tRNA(Gln) amidotransferase subunit B
MAYQPTIGLEIHIELNTKSKMFCPCPNDPDEKHPNINICPICMGHPGTLPVINKEAVKKVIKTALALNCKIHKKAYFERKNYFYPDLPKGYQISQYSAPLSKNGYLDIQVIAKAMRISSSSLPSPLRGSVGEDERSSSTTRAAANSEETSSLLYLRPATRDSVAEEEDSSSSPIPVKIRIERIHLEEDTAKLIHPAGKDYSLIDFNRAGIPLMELVTEPDIHSVPEARGFIRELQLILRYLGVSDADMEKGEMRAEVNISLTRINADQDADKRGNISVNQRSNQRKSASLGTKVEIKNLNSLRAVEKGIEYEIKRQSEILESGKKVVQETRGWLDEATASSRRVASARVDDVKGITVSQREKEEASDYRYFPEPDLPPLNLNDEFLKEIKTEISELPQERRRRFEKEYKLDKKTIEVLIFNKELGEYFEKVTSELVVWVKDEKNKLKVTDEEFKKLAKLTSNYILTDLQGLLKGVSTKSEKFLISPENFAEFISMIYMNEISSKIAKTLLKEMFDKGTDPSQIMAEKKLSLINDETELEKIIKEVLNKNPKPAEDYKKGKETALQFLIGQVMTWTKGKASPEIVNKILKKLLS